MKKLNKEAVKSIKLGICALVLELIALFAYLKYLPIPMYIAHFIFAVSTVLIILSLIGHLQRKGVVK